jgi:hypothetical protein
VPLNPFKARRLLVATPQCCTANRTTPRRLDQRPASPAPSVTTQGSPPDLDGGYSYRVTLSVGLHDLPTRRPHVIEPIDDVDIPALRVRRDAVRQHARTH